ncbi:MAG: hypothetical protein ACRCUM_03990 [Mycoplasmoidaceae bacterium]
MKRSYIMELEEEFKKREKDIDEIGYVIHQIEYLFNNTATGLSNIMNKANGIDDKRDFNSIIRNLSNKYNEEMKYDLIEEIDFYDYEVIPKSVLMDEKYKLQKMRLIANEIHKQYPVYGFTFGENGDSVFLELGDSGFSVLIDNGVKNNMSYEYDREILNKINWDRCINVEKLEPSEALEEFAELKYNFANEISDEKPKQKTGQ